MTAFHPSLQASTSGTASVLRGSGLPACSAFDITGQAEARSRVRLAVAVLVAILLHLLGAAVMGWHLGWIATNTPAAIPLPEPAESLRYVILPDDAAPEEIRPEDAQSEGRVSRLARVPDPVPDAPRRAADPASETDRIYSALAGEDQRDGQDGAPTPEMPPPAPRPAPPPTPQAPPAPRPVPERPAIHRTPPFPRMPDATDTLAVSPEQAEPTPPTPDTPAPDAPSPERPAQPPRPPTPEAPDAPQRPESPRTPPVRRIGDRGGDGGAPLPRAMQSSGVRAGGRSLAVLGSRYPGFMEELVRRLQRSIAFEQQRNPLQYRAATVVVTFRVDEAGMIQNIRFVESHPAGLQIEPAIARRVVETVQTWGALPIPTPEMLADPDFQTITIIFDFIP